MNEPGGPPWLSWVNRLLTANDFLHPSTFTVPLAAPFKSGSNIVPLTTFHSGNVEKSGGGVPCLRRSGFAQASGLF